MLYKQAQQFQEAYANIKTKHFPISVAYKLMLINKDATDCISFFENQYAEIIAEYAQKDENGQIVQTEEGNIKIIPEKINDAAQRINELETFEIQIDQNKLLTLDELQIINDECKLTLEDLEIFMQVTLKNN